MRQQLVVSGLGGQGILFLTRLLAETAIAKGLPVLTSETHGMAQRGGVVISHLKVGEFHSPLVRPGQGDGLLSLKGETVPLHLHFLKEGGWVAANAPAGDWLRMCLSPAAGSSSAVSSSAGQVAIDADAVALGLGDPQAVNLIVLGRALREPGRLFCTVEEVEAALRARLEGKEGALARALAALRAGLE